MDQVKGNWNNLKDRKIAFLFSGQGAQYSGMGKELAEISPAAKAVFDMADAVRPDTAKQCYEAAKEELSQTINTQPCLFCVDLAAAAAVLEQGIRPQAVAGFSLGEFAAIAVAGVISDQDAFRLVCKRAEYMDAASRKTNSTMAAVIKLTPQQVEDICSRHEGIYPVNYNCSSQVVVAGKAGGFDDFASEVKEHKGRVMPLAVSGGFHSPYMDDAAVAFGEEVQKYDFAEPNIPVYANYTGKPYTGGGAVVADMLHKQLSNPVQWETTIQNMVADGVDLFIEVGAGKTLSGLVKKIAPEIMALQVENKETLEQTLAALKAL